MNLQNVKMRNENEVAYVTIANPPANALNRQTLQDLDRAITMAIEDDQVKVIVLTGEGRFFVAGADIKEFTSVESKHQGTELALRGQEMLNKIDHSPKPVIAMINGLCLGGGLELAMACHIRIAADSAKLGQPELNLGLIPGFAGTQRLARLTGREKATELILTSDPIDGQEASRIGLVAKSVPLEELEAAVKSMTDKIMGKGALAIRAALLAIQQGVVNGFESGAQKEAELFGELFESEDTKEGIQAFLEKRAPLFKNR